MVSQLLFIFPANEKTQNLLPFPKMIWIFSSLPQEATHHIFLQVLHLQCRLNTDHTNMHPWSPGESRLGRLVVFALSFSNPFHSPGLLASNLYLAVLVSLKGASQAIEEEPETIMTV